MATEHPRDGGRSEPLVADGWRKGHRWLKKKFGLRGTYRATTWFYKDGEFESFANEYTVTHWYRTARARDQAMECARKTEYFIRDGILLAAVER